MATSLCKVSSDPKLTKEAQFELDCVTIAGLIGFISEAIFLAFRINEIVGVFWAVLFAILTVFILGFLRLRLLLLFSVPSEQGSVLLTSTRHTIELFAVVFPIFIWFLVSVYVLKIL